MTTTIEYNITDLHQMLHLQFIKNINVSNHRATERKLQELRNKYNCNNDVLHFIDHINNNYFNLNNKISIYLLQKLNLHHLHTNTYIHNLQTKEFIIDFICFLEPLMNIYFTQNTLITEISLFKKQLKRMKITKKTNNKKETDVLNETEIQHDTDFKIVNENICL